MIEADVTLQFLCSNCGTKIPHDYSREDLHKSAPLQFVCPKCDAVITKTGSEILDMAKKEIIKELQR